MAGTCVIEGCGKPHDSHGYCGAHAQRLRRHGDPLAGDRMRLVNAEPMERFERFITRSTDGCWLWNAAIGDHGYGQFYDGERLCLAHRYAYEQFVAPIPDGLHIDHLCRVRACVRPDHLEAVTQAENNRRANAVRWARTA